MRSDAPGKSKREKRRRCFQKGCGEADFPMPEKYLLRRRPGKQFAALRRRRGLTCSEVEAMQEGGGAVRRCFPEQSVSGGVFMIRGSVCRNICALKKHGDAGGRRSMKTRPIPGGVCKRERKGYEKAASRIGKPLEVFHIPCRGRAVSLSAGIQSRRAEPALFQSAGSAEAGSEASRIRSR